MITIIASFRVKQECIETFRAMAAECVEASRKEEGSSSYHLYTGLTDKTKFFFVENWSDEKAIEQHNTRSLQELSHRLFQNLQLSNRQ